MADFSFFVTHKAFKKAPYDTWRTINNINSNNCNQVRIYWEHKKDNIWIDIIFDRVGQSEMFVFETGDGSFGDFIYEYYLYGPEIDQMGDKEEHWYDSNGTLHVGYDGSSYYSISSDDLKSYGLGVSALNDKADVVCDTLATKADVAALNKIEDKVNTLAEKAALAEPMTNSTIINTENKKEKNIMKFNFDFGPVNSAIVRMSLYGLAVKNKAGTYVSYDANTGDIMDVDILNFDGAKFLYKMPVAVKDVAIGDVIVHMNAPMFVTGFGDGFVIAVDPIAGERKEIMLTKSPFGFNFVTKVVNFLGNLGGTASNDNPFGNLGLMLMLGDNKDMNDLLPLMMMVGGMDMSNPMMMWALMGNRTNDPMMLAMAMGAFNKPATPAHTCTCGGHCGESNAQS